MPAIHSDQIGTTQSKWQSESEEGTRPGFGADQSPCPRVILLRQSGWCCRREIAGVAWSIELVKLTESLARSPRLLA